VVSHPTPRPAALEWVSPTLANDLASCAYRVAWRLDHRFDWLRRPTPRSQLGVVAHACVEEVGRGLLEGASSREEAQARVKRAWDLHLAQGRSVLAEEWAPAEPPAPEDWPGYHLIRARVIGRALRLFDRETRPEPARAATMLEETLGDPATEIAGRPDRVESSPSGLSVVDLKTGLAQDQPTEAQRRQLLLYAHLVHVATGEMPVKMAVEGPAGRRWEEEVTSASVAAAVGEVTALRARFTATVSEGRVESLAAPGEETCRWCPYRLVCGPYWDSLETSWGHGSVLGRILRREYRPGGVVITVRVESPVDAAASEWKVAGPVRLPGVPGQVLAIIAAEIADDSILRWTWSTVIQTL
jgi:hypothetical protein